MKQWLEETMAIPIGTFRRSDMEQTIVVYRVPTASGPKLVYHLLYGPDGSHGWDALIPASEENSIESTIAALDTYIGVEER